MRITRAEKNGPTNVVPGWWWATPLFANAARHHKFLTLFTPVAGSDKAAIIVHGMGIHPDWGWSARCVPNWPTRVDDAVDPDADPGRRRPERSLPADLFQRRPNVSVEAVAFLKAKGYSQLATFHTANGSR